jgi:hypothetical protein
MPGKGRSTESKFGRRIFAFFGNLEAHSKYADIRGEKVPLLRVSTSGNTNAGTMPTYVVAPLPMIRQALNNLQGYNRAWEENWEDVHWRDKLYDEF